ncbi:ABC transporter ATP-binding protein [Liberiplasma polymorphum]|uniref:ABC transporter ATP-binding protein n=1 Tax=Liberiplasma polymorphum TaxID=3374570 RepID=UPI003770C42A
MNKLLEVNDLHVSYGAIQALKGIDLEVHEGSIVAILGANGGGKTTLLKKISGVVPAQKGTVTFNGIDITKTSPEKITNLGIVQSPEGRQIFGDLSVYENLMIGAFTVKQHEVRWPRIYDEVKTPRIEALYKLQKEQGLKDEDINVLLNRKEMIANNLERVYDYFPVLKERSKQIAQTLSGGEQQMLAIGRALMGTPKLLVLDEPSLGLAPLIVQNIFKIISELNAEGITVLIVEQNALQTLKIADYAYVIQVGKLIKEGKASTLINDPKLIEAYLGN